MGVHAGEVQIPGVAAFDQPFRDVVQAFARNVVAPEFRLDDVVHGDDGAGGANGIVPAAGKKNALDDLEFLSRDAFRRRHAGRVDAAVLEVAVGQVRAADIEALGELWLKALPQDQFGAAAAYVYDQARVMVVLQRVGDAEVDQPGFLSTADDLHLVAEDFLGASDELLAVARLTQGIGAHYAHIALRQQTETLAQPFEAFQCAGGGFGTEHVGRAKALGQAHHFPVFVDYLKPVAPVQSDDEVKAVGTEIQRCVGLLCVVLRTGADFGHLGEILLRRRRSLPPRVESIGIDERGDCAL